MPNANLGPDHFTAQRLTNIENQLRNMMTSPWLLNASTGQVPGQPGLATDINGLHLFNSAGVEDITLSTADGSANFNGPVTIGGTLSLPAGIIGNDALASPVGAAQVSNSQTGFATTATAQPFASATIPVPAGFSTALVFAVTIAGAINSTASPDYLYTSTSIQGVASREVFGYAGPSGGSTAVTTAKSTLLTGLSGGNITIAALIHSGAAWAANGSNRAYVEAQAIFLR